MPTNMRTAMGTFIAAVLCTLATVALWILPFVLSRGSDPNKTGWVVLVLYSVVPAGLAAVLFLLSVIYFFIGLADRRPG
jgi:branched-subunit amino acid transport protein AzlD